MAAKNLANNFKIYLQTKMLNEKFMNVICKLSYMLKIKIKNQFNLN